MDNFTPGNPMPVGPMKFKDMSAMKAPFEVTPLHLVMEEAAQEIADNAINKTLTLGLIDYDPDAFERMGLTECKKHLQITDLGPNSWLIYWKPTGVLIMLMDYPIIEFGLDNKMHANVKYRIATDGERAQLAMLRG